MLGVWYRGTSLIRNRLAGAHTQREPKKGRSRLEARSDMIELVEDDGTDGAARGGEAAPGSMSCLVTFMEF